MKKIFMRIFLIVLAMLIIICTIYLINYKNINKIKTLLSKSDNISNMYVEHYINYGEYSNNIKDYKVDIFVKDNVYIYDVLGRIDYANYNTKECYSIQNNVKTEVIDIDQVKKFNDYSDYFDQNVYTYSYNFPCLINHTLCDKITLKNSSNTSKVVIYINKENGLVMKKLVISKGNKSVETFNYQFNVVTDEKINLLCHN